MAGMEPMAPMYCIGGGNPRAEWWAGGAWPGLVSAPAPAHLCMVASSAPLSCTSFSCWGEGVESEHNGNK